MPNRFLTVIQAAVAFLALAASTLGMAPCRIEVVEKGTGWPVPLVELRTVHHVRLVSDNAGLIAFDLPELMGRETWFDVIGHGYSVPKDGFGMRGVRLTPESGKTLRVEVARDILAKRIGRLTGAGLFAESQKLGLAEPPAESGVLGCDSVQNAVHRGKLYWFWGDTSLARYPLGIFDATGATTATMPLGSLEPPLKLRLDYFTDPQGRPRAVAKLPGKGPTWPTGFISLPDREGTPHLVATYSKVAPPLEAWQWGLTTWNDATGNFEPFRVLWTKGEGGPEPPPMPNGHPVIWKDDAGRPWAIFGDPFPTLRMPANYEAWQDQGTWEPLTPQASVESAADGEEVRPHRGSIAWSPYRNRWVAIFTQHFGRPSALGEIWYAEADSPTGPWGPAAKILSHEDYTFYNPRIHPEFTPEGSRALFFEGTYTATFSGNKQPTPRYDYNQILYRLDLDEPGLRSTHGPGGMP
jgi:hypothetical protein